MADYDMMIRSWNDQEKTVGSGEDTHTIVINPPSYRLIISEDWEGIFDQAGDGPGIKTAYIIENDSFGISNGHAWTMNFTKKGWSKNNKKITGIEGFSLLPVKVGLGTVPANAVDLSGSTKQTEHLPEIMRYQAFTNLMNQLFGTQKNMSGCKAVFDFSIVSDAVEVTFRHPVIFAWKLNHPSTPVSSDGSIEIFALSGSALGNYQFKLDSDSYADIASETSYHHIITGLGNGTYNLRIRDKDNADADHTSVAIDLVLEDTLL